MNAGDTFRFRSGDEHLWMVISDPGVDSSKALLVNCTTWRADKEQTCLLNPGDHPAIEHNSVVYYAGSRVHSLVHLHYLLNNDKIVLHDPLSAQVLTRVREGAASSKQIRLDHGQILFDQNLVEP